MDSKTLVLSGLTYVICVITFSQGWRISGSVIWMMRYTFDACYPSEIVKVVKEKDEQGPGFIVLYSYTDDEGFKHTVPSMGWFPGEPDRAVGDVCKIYVDETRKQAMEQREFRAIAFEGVLYLIITIAGSFIFEWIVL